MTDSKNDVVSTYCTGRWRKSAGRLGVVVALGVVGVAVVGPMGSSAETASAASAAQAADDDPRTAPVPEIPVDDEAKSLVATVDFDGRSTVTPVGSEVRIGAAASHAADPPLLELEVRDGDGTVLEAFNAWHPLWVFTESDDGGEHLVVRDQAQGSFVVPFDRDAATMAVTDVAMDEEVAEVDLTGAIGDFCQEHPTSEGCRVADLAVTDVSVAAEPDLALVGTTSTVSIDTTVTNLGPATPVDATVSHVATPADSGLTVTPTTASTDQALAVGDEEVVGRDYQVTCVTPGFHDITFTSSVAPSHPADVDRSPANDEDSTTLTVDCVVPVTLNVLTPDIPVGPGGFNGPISVAFLTTRAGEYGNPIAFNAARIDPSSTTFGTRSVVLSGGGATALLGLGVVRDLPERPPVIRPDGDPDMLIIYTPASATGLVRGGRTHFKEGCARGELTSGTTTLRFYGCGQDA